MALLSSFHLTHSRPAFLLGLVLLFLGVETSWAQGFSQINGRNHAELDWRSAETEHFKIIYPAHLDGLEVQAAAIAEACFDSLAANFEVTFDKKLRIYLSDEDEIANGFAVPIGTGFTNIWVHANAFAIHWTGADKWLRKVIAHELAHLFHYRATRSNLGAYSYLFSKPRPRFWTEGLAQYMAENWDAQRGERWLRTAALEARPSFTDESSTWNDRLMYASGHGQVRYFADQYGDSSLVRLLHHRKPAFLGMGHVHDFQAAFRDVTGESYSAFKSRWVERLTSTYHALAEQLESPSSLPVDSLALPLQYVHGMQYSPDGKTLALVGQPTLDRPVQGLYLWDLQSDRAQPVAEGRVQSGFAWHPDGNQLAFVRRVRGDYGSWVHDLYLLNLATRKTDRLSYSLRTTAPTFSPDGRSLAFVSTERGTANVFLVNLDLRRTTRLTSFKGDVQITALAWHPRKAILALTRMTAEGNREVLLLDVSSQTVQAVYSGPVDYRNPVWAPHTDELAVTSLQDGVPNLFVFEVPDAPQNPIDRLWPSPWAIRRITHLTTGAFTEDWLPPTDEFPQGRFLIRTGETKTRDVAYLLDARHTSLTPTPIPPVGYTRWTTKQPEHPLPSTASLAPTPILSRKVYRSWRNLTHVISGVLPFYQSAAKWGIGGGTGWVEPLGKHTIGAFGTLSFGDLAESLLLIRYINRTWRPTLTVGIYRFPGFARRYGPNLLIESIRGGDVTWRWPLELTDAPYTSARLGVRMRIVNVEPLNLEKFTDLPEGLRPPESGLQADIRISLQYKKMRPYAYNVAHPLDGYGIRLRLKGVPLLPETDLQFIRPELSAYAILPGPGWSRWYLHGRARLQFGTSLAQDFIGFRQNDGIDVNLSFFRIGSGLNRVRGYRTYVIGNRVLFGTVEYRVPVFRKLNLKPFPFLKFGFVSLAAFSDAGMVWNHTAYKDATRQMGVGAEMKYTIEVAGFKILHSVGMAQTVGNLGGGAIDFYQRFHTAVPF